MPSFSRSTKISFVLFLLLASWWFAAGTRQPKADSQPHFTSSPILTIDRKTLHKALSGDTNRMIGLMTDWDHVAERYEKEGITDIERLHPDDWIFIEHFKYTHSTPSSFKPVTLTDDNGEPFTFKSPAEQILPQTYCATNIALALIPPERVVAIPDGMRHLSQFHRPSRLKAIPLDTNRRNAEKIYTLKPDIAFVANYSLPSTLSAFKQQGISTFTINSIDDPEAICGNIERIGKIVGEASKAHLLSLFVKAAFYRIDNEVKMLNPSPSPILCLSYYNHFSTPTHNSLTGKLLNRLGFETLDQRLTITLPKASWAFQPTSEQIHLDKAERIIFPINPENSHPHILTSHPATKHLNPVKQGNVVFLDSTTQTSVSQYVVMAYLDLFNACYGEVVH